jgi:integrase
MNDKWSIDDFLSQYSSSNTINTYRSIFRQYFPLFNTELQRLKRKELGKRLPEISLKYIKEDRDFRKDLEFKKSINHQAPKTITTKIACMLRYFESNQIDFNDNFTRNLYGTGSGEAISREKVPTNQELARIIEYLPIQAKTLTMVLASSGMRVGEAVKIKLNDLDLQSTPPKISLKASYTKTKKKRITFISNEAKNQLEEWLQYRPKYLETNKSYYSGSKMANYLQLVFPFSLSNFREIWRDALKKSRLYSQDPKTGRISLRSHNLRKFFRTHGKWSNPDVAEALMGHTSGLKAIYARLDQAEDILREGYLEAEQNLSIYQNSKTIQELREKVDKQSDDIEQLVANLSLKNVRLENEMEDLKEQMKTNLEAALFYYDNTENMYQHTILEIRERIANLEKLLEDKDLKPKERSVLDFNLIPVDHKDEDILSSSVPNDLLVKMRQTGLKPDEIVQLYEYYNNKIPSISDSAQAD